jgi:glutathione S-transferase
MSEWGHYKRRMPKGQVPVLSLPDGTLMPEMNDICRYLAQVSSPAGRQLVVDDRQDGIMLAVNGALLDRVAHITNMYPIEYAVEESDSVREQATTFLRQFSTMLEGADFFGGVTPGYGELGLWYLVEDCVLLVPDLLDHLEPHLKQWYARVANLPGLAEYLASRPQVGEGTYGMPGSILHGGRPTS